jgi:hypothetical protein
MQPTGNYNNDVKCVCHNQSENLLFLQTT